MTTPRFPAHGYAGSPDWNDLLRDFGPSMFFDGISIADLIERLAGQTAFLAVPYQEQSRAGREKVAAEATLLEIALFGEVVCHCPAAFAERILRHRGTGDNPADHPKVWRDICERLFIATGPVIIPPVHGWEESQELYQIAGTALSALRPVFVLNSEDL